MILADLLARINSFHALKKGWDGYDGEPISPNAIKAARGLAAEYTFFTFGAPLSYGGVQLETSGRSPHETFVEVECNPDGHTFGILAGCVNGDHQLDFEYELNDIRLEQLHELLDAWWSRN